MKILFFTSILVFVLSGCSSDDAARRGILEQSAEPNPDSSSLLQDTYE
ncbi:MAG: hypothetical protein WC777_01655 [Candidatus Gracilibacteria bacterium]|jgi:hypothetical protein